MKLLKNCLLAAAILLCLLLLPLSASAEEAADITNATNFSGTG